MYGFSTSGTFWVSNDYAVGRYDSASLPVKVCVPIDLIGTYLCYVVDP